MESGLVRLFPLPQIVLFPGTLIPLHVFEPRYRELVTEALESDRRLALALLRPGYEKDYEGAPEIHPVVVVGKIVDHFRLPDGRYNIAVVGLGRVRVVEEVPGRSFRRARVEPMADGGGPVDPARLAWFLDLLHLLLCRGPGAVRQIDFFPGERARAGRLADRAAAALRIDDGTKQAMLEEVDVPKRIERLVGELETIIQRHLVPEVGPFHAPFRFDGN